jgi:hypothetical protein
LIPKPLAKRIKEAGDPLPPELQAVVDAEMAEVVDKMERLGFKLAGRLGEGEGVFVRDTDLTALHVHLPRSLYQALDEEARRSEMPKRRVVISALEEYLDLEA